MDVATVQKNQLMVRAGRRGRCRYRRIIAERFITEQATLPIDEIGRSLRGFADREFTVPAP